MDLSDASLCTLLDTVGTVEKHVQILDLSMNFLTGSANDNQRSEALHSGFADKFPDVQSVDLSGNSLTSIPRFVTAFRNLKVGLQRNRKRCELATRSRVRAPAR